jgi:signal transduction histidine kinase
VKEDAQLCIDTNQITQVFINLIQNSLDAISGKGNIAIRAEVRGKNYVIAVTDTGSGISEDHIDKIFDLYYTTRKKGLGMGLAIVYQIINRHNGSIEVSSRMGEETKFTITLPIKDK